MKPSSSTISRQNKQIASSSKPRPEIRDDLDSRSQKGETYRGDKSKKGDR